MIIMKYKREIRKELSKTEYSQFIKKVIKYNQNHGELAPYIMLDNTKIYKNEYIEAIESVNKFILENGREPEKTIIYAKKHH